MSKLARDASPGASVVADAAMRAPAHDGASADVIVVGAGPGGCIAAAQLASAGVRTLLIEKATLPRYKTCGGGIVRRALRWAGDAASKSSEAHAFRAHLTFSDVPEHFELREDDAPLVSLVMRDRFDQALALAAESAGASLLQACAVRGAERRDGFWYLSTDRGTLRAPIVVAADGARSRMAQCAGWKPGAVAAALEWEVAVDDATLAAFDQQVRFDFDARLRGYAWVFPKRDRLSVGLLSTRTAPRDLPAALQRYLQARGIAPRGREGGAIERHAWMIPIAPRALPLARDGVLLVGDAAGLVDPVTAEGISSALQSGALAARSVLAAEGNAAEASRYYQRALQQELLPELRWARRLTHVLYGPQWARRALFPCFGMLFCTAMGAIIDGRHTYGSLLGRPGPLLRALRPRQPQQLVEE